MEDSSTMARKTWELENNIPVLVSDDIFNYDDTAQAKIKQEKPWASDPNYFKHVKISALALLKMVVHARSGKVEIGAFRTYPEGHKISDDHVSHEYQSIPLDKIEDFRVHRKQYYSLDITYFKSSLDSHLLDLLWNMFWIDTLSSSPFLGNKDYVAGQISDLADKLEQVEIQMEHSPATSELAKITRDSAKLTVEQVHGLMSQVIKDMLFNPTRESNKPPSDPSDPS